MPIYNKLIRDRIPEIIQNDNKKFQTRVLNEQEYHSALLDKINEELIELREAKNNHEAQEELSDLLELIHALSRVYNTNINEIDKIRISKKEKRGGFEKKLFLIDVKDENSN